MHATNNFDQDCSYNVGKLQDKAFTKYMEEDR